MKYLMSLVIGLASIISAPCQGINPKTDFNLDFERVTNVGPIGWASFGEGDYRIGIDSLTVKSGKYSGSIKFQGGNPGYSAWALSIPGSYPGKQIKLSGYIKTENVDGFAGLWMRIDPRVAFNNMQQEGLKGTTDWRHYEINLKMNPDKTEQTVLGGLLVGSGSVWFDSLSVTIDGKNIELLQPVKKIRVPAQLDTTYDHGSNLNISLHDEALLERLKVLGLVWGFIKYYHPAVAAGDVNWDYALFRVLPEILEAKDNKDRDEILAKWITELGAVTKSDGEGVPTIKAILEPDLEWIDTMGLSSTLQQILTEVKHATRTGKHFYVSLHPNVGNPDFSNENPYRGMRVEDDGFRLLALYRYWNMIQYFFPYRHLIGEDWKNVLGEFIPKFLQTEDTQSYLLATLELIGRIHDTHANLWGNYSALNEFLGARHAAVELQFIEEQPVITGYRHSDWGPSTELKVGDIVTSIDGEPVSNIVKRLLKYTPASNYTTQLRDVAPKLLRSNDTTLRLEISRNGEKLSLLINTYEAKLLKRYSRLFSTDSSFRMLTEDIAYLNNGTLNPDSLDEYWEQIKYTKGLIIDNRNYPRLPGADRLGEFLMPNRVPFAKFSFCNITEPGAIELGGMPMSTGKDDELFYPGRVVILVNETTQSAAEFHAMSYRVHPNATVIGSTTAGADGNVSTIILPGGISTAISGIGVYYPDGTETQRIGIVPDIIVTPTIEGIKAGRDEVLEDAVQFINKQGDAQ